MSDDYDAIIVGSGAGGGTLAHRLAPSGKRVLILERGDWLPREIENWDAEAVFVQNRYVSADTWYDGSGKPFQPQIHYNVGGATKFYGAALYRLREQDFGELSTTAGSHPPGPSATTCSSPTTPRARALPRARPPGRGPTEPPASAPYPFPGLPRGPDPGAVRGPGCRGPTPVPLAQRHHARRGAPGVQHVHPLRTCDGFPCLVHAKADADVVAVVRRSVTTTSRWFATPR